MRNYLDEMDQLIGAAGADQDAAPLAALQLLQQLRAEDPDLLAGWLEARAAAFLAHAIRSHAPGRAA